MFFSYAPMLFSYVPMLFSYAPYTHVLRICIHVAFIYTHDLLIFIHSCLIIPMFQSSPCSSHMYPFSLRKFPCSSHKYPRIFHSTDVISGALYSFQMRSFIYQSYSPMLQDSLHIYNLRPIFTTTLPIFINISSNTLLCLKVSIYEYNCPIS